MNLQDYIKKEEIKNKFKDLLSEEPLIKENSPYSFHDLKNEVLENLRNDSDFIKSLKGEKGDQGAKGLDADNWNYTYGGDGGISRVEMDAYPKLGGDLDAQMRGINNVCHLNFSTEEITPHPNEVGSLYFDDEDRTLSVILDSSTLQIGQETYIRVLNNTGSTISNGKLVWVNGAQGNRPTVALVSNQDYDKATRVIGMATHDIQNNTIGMITIIGLVRDLNTKDIPEGTELFLGSIPGEYTTVRPALGEARIIIGIVIKEHVEDGWIFIRINEDKYMFGDIPSGSYSMFEDDGTLVFIGDSRIFKDKTGDILSLQQIGTGVSRNNQEATVDFNIFSNLDDYVFTNVQINHDKDVSTSIYPHIHWIQTTSGSPNFLLQYRWQTLGGNFTSAWISLPCTNIAFNGSVSASKHQVSYSLPIVPPANSNLSDIIQFRVLRDNLNASGLFSGNDPINITISVLSFDVHYIVNTIGSREMFIK